MEVVEAWRRGVEVWRACRYCGLDAGREIRTVASAPPFFTVAVVRECSATRGVPLHPGGLLHLTYTEGWVAKTMRLRGDRKTSEIVSPL
jgi:hypothetical protein